MRLSHELLGEARHGSEDRPVGGSEQESQRWKSSHGEGHTGAQQPEAITAATGWVDRWMHGKQLVWQLGGSQ